MLKKQQEDMMKEMQANLQDAAKQAKEEIEVSPSASPPGPHVSLPLTAILN